MDELDAKLTSQREAFQDTAEKVRSMTSDVVGVIGDLKDAVSPLEGVSQQFGVVTEQLGSVAESIKTTHGEISIVGGNLATTSDTMRAAWEAHRDRFDGVDRILERLLEQLTTAADS